MSLNFDLVMRVKGNKDIYVLNKNITHNLSPMAGKADVYNCLWLHEEKGYKIAREIIKPLKKGIKKLKSKPKYYQQFDDPAGWGTYEQFLPWLEEVLQGCIDYPSAEIEIMWGS